MKFIIKTLILFIAISLLTACNSKWNVDVELSAEEVQIVQSDITRLKNEIKNFAPSEEGLIPWAEYIELSKSYEKLGDLKNAIKVYTNVLKSGAKTNAIINNLGRLYEKINEYDLAVEQYRRIINEYNDEGYLYDITWAYIRAAKNEKGDKAVFYRKEAEKNFNAWQMAFRKTDEQTQGEIRKLREEEKNNS